MNYTILHFFTTLLNFSNSLIKLGCRHIFSKDFISHTFSDV